MIDDVKRFMIKMGFQVNNRPVMLTHKNGLERHNFMQEELHEFAVALANDDLSGMADALIDLVYFALGTAVAMGLPWRKLWNAVHEANMQKIPLLSRRGSDAGKSENWEHPNIDKIISESEE
jgi:predicted HAD superfamily Cof-like phosphohydrolase